MSEAKSSVADKPKVVIRRAAAEDCETIAELIKELAAFEREPENAKLTAAQLKEDGFGKNPAFLVCYVTCFRCFTLCFGQAFVADVDSKTVAFALCSFSYSTRFGRCLHLEDLFVQPDYRGVVRSVVCLCNFTQTRLTHTQPLRLGMNLMRRCTKAALQLKCARLSWQVQKWNTPARELGKEIGAEELTDWLPHRFDAKAMQRFLSASVDIVHDEA